jgi:hypothetical protein
MTRIWMLTLVVALFSCINNEGSHNKLNLDQKAMDKFEAFIQKEKFVEDTTIFYPGIADPALRPLLTEKMNQAAEDFKSVSLTADATKTAYVEKIKLGLDRFLNTEVMNDTEDRERVCHYFEELMDIVGLESSEGLLNNFMYGFNPGDSKNDH